MEESGFSFVSEPVMFDGHEPIPVLSTAHGSSDGLASIPSEDKVKNVHRGLC